MKETTTSRHDPSTIQLAARVPRDLHKRFYEECATRDVTGSEMLRILMAQFVRMAEAQRA